MALLWIDGFDHYGMDANLLAGAYDWVSLTSIDASNPRTDERCIRILGGFNSGVRRIFGLDAPVIGVGHAFFINRLPSDNASLCLAALKDNTGQTVLSVGVGAVGQIIVRQGGFQTGITLAMSVPCVTSAAYNHFEVRAESSVGIEVRINGVTRVNYTGPGVTAATYAMVAIGTDGQGVFGFPNYLLVDDLFAWDGSGPWNNDFVGDRKVYLGLPVSDGAEQGWIPSIGSDGYEMIDNVPPLDSTEYLLSEHGGSGGDRSTFGVSNYPHVIASISGVMLATRAWKTDAGVGSLRTGVISGVAEENTPEHVVLGAPLWYHDVYEIDPATGTPWLLAAVNDLETVIERTE